MSIIWNIKKVFPRLRAGFTWTISEEILQKYLRVFSSISGRGNLLVFVLSLVSFNSERNSVGRSGQRDVHFVDVQRKQAWLLGFVLVVLLHKQVLKGVVLSGLTVGRTVEWLTENISEVDTRKSFSFPRNYPCDVWHPCAIPKFGTNGRGLFWKNGLFGSWSGTPGKNTDDPLYGEDDDNVDSLREDDIGDDACRCFTEMLSSGIGDDTVWPISCGSSWNFRPLNIRFKGFTWLILIL